FIFYVRAYADLAAATETEMTTRLVVGDDSFFDSSDWNQRKNDWRHIFWWSPAVNMRLVRQRVRSRLR
ncbi:MAG: hypothetical protein ABGY42_13330, partial [bacterium]